MYVHIYTYLFREKERTEQYRNNVKTLRIEVKMFGLSLIDLGILVIIYINDHSISLVLTGNTSTNYCIFSLNYMSKFT
jgi:hypothetical protein